MKHEDFMRQLSIKGKPYTIYDINPLVPVELIVDHSVQVDYHGTAQALKRNVDLEYQRNAERYMLLKWAQGSFDNFKVVPPNSGICHQVNLEHLGRVIMTEKGENEAIAFPDTLVGTDSHTPMINGIGVMGWGVGGIEAEAVMLGQPYYMSIPEMIGVRLVGELPPGVTATRTDGQKITFDVVARLNTDVDVAYFEHGGILPYVLRKLINEPS
ncbi:MAG: hypothetical protein GY737_24575 [Desulfobacteraceae bacterium]|nr:hypothetical protein [Desulfobacteraceae bacterium]